MQVSAVFLSSGNKQLIQCWLFCVLLNICTFPEANYFQKPNIAALEAKYSGLIGDLAFISVFRLIFCVLMLSLVLCMCFAFEMAGFSL